MVCIFNNKGTGEILNKQKRIFHRFIWVLYTLIIIMFIRDVGT